MRNRTLIFNQKWRCLFVSVTLLCTANDASAKAFTVEGEIHYERLQFRQERFTDQIDHSRGVRFRIHVDGYRWFMHLRPMAQDDALMLYDYTEYAFDGRRLYRLRSIESWVDNQVKAGAEVGANTANATILPYPVPQISTTHEAGPVWLAYASAYYFDKLRDDMALVPFTRGVGKDGLISAIEKYKQKLVLQRSGANPRIPSHAFYVETQPENRYPGAFTNAVYQVETFADVGGLAIPKIARATVFVPHGQPGEYEANLWAVHRYRIEAHEIHLEARLDSWLPEVPLATHFNDHRFREDRNNPITGSIRYFGEGRWYTDAEVRRLPEYKRALAQSQSGAPQRPGVRKPLILALLIFVLIAPVALLFYRGSRSAK